MLNIFIINQIICRRLQGLNHQLGRLLQEGALNAAHHIATRREVLRDVYALLVIELAHKALLDDENTLRYATACEYHLALFGLLELHNRT